MTRQTLPNGLVPDGGTPTFTSDTLPAAVRAEHALGATRWGVLHILEGSATFVDLKSGSERKLTAPDTQVIAPVAPHKLHVTGDVTCRIDFFAEEGDAREAPGECSESDPVRQGLERCEKAGDFASAFYDVFLGASPEIAPFFANTDFAKQRKLLNATVQIMVRRRVSDISTREMLERIGTSHDRGHLAIPPRLYDVWLDSVCLTVEALDPEWTDELGDWWRDRLRAGIQLITAAY